jgi:hypothetical protein
MRVIRKSPSVVAAAAVLVIVSSVAAFGGSFAVAQLHEPTAQASNAVPQAQSAAACTPARKRQLERALAKYKRAMPKQRRRYFRSHASAKQRKVFVRRQRAKLNVLQRRVKKCVVPGPTPTPSPPPPGPVPTPEATPTPPPADGDTTAPLVPELEASALSNAVRDGATIWYRPSARAAFSLSATASDPESEIASVSFPDLGARWTGGGVKSGPPYSTAYALEPEPLDAKVTDGAISLTRADGGPLGGIAPGAYEVRVDDESANESFRLFGPGVSEATSDEFQGEASWSVALRPGKTYRFQSDASTDQLKGELATGEAYAEPGTKGVTALNGAGLTSPQAALNVRADGNAPETSVDCDGASCSLSATDAGSGVDGIRYTLDGTLPSAEHGTRYSGPFPVSATTTVRFVAFDRVGNLEQLREHLVTRPEPQDTLVAPPLDPGVPFNFADGTEFLYAGPDAVQTGVDPGTIAARRVAVIRGRVVNRAGEPLPDVKVTVLDHPELGQTLTRAGGHFDLAVNGGGRLTLDFEREGLIPCSARSTRTGRTSRTWTTS